MTFKIKKLVLY